MSLKEIVKDSVAILSPCANSVEPRVYQFGMVLAANASANGYPVRQVGVTERTMIHTARNCLAKGFLETDCEWAFWMDSDMILEARTIPVMMGWAKRLNAKFLTGIYYQRMGRHVPVVLVRDEQSRKYEDEYSMTPVLAPEGQKNPFKVHSAGFGCILMHRDVLTALKEPYFRYSYISESKEFSEDFYFCKKAREAGIDLWAVPELVCGHVGQAPVITRADCQPDKEVQALNVEVAN